MDYSNIYSWLHQQVVIASTKIADGSTGLNQIVIETPKQKSHGDLSTNAAMVLAKELKKSPREIAELLLKELSSREEFAKIEIAGPGFINFTFQHSFWQNVLLNIISKDSDFGKSDAGKNVKVNIEFVSANPTGPMHIGHARGAVLGDVYARLMSFLGYEVTREYYVNDAGSQINTLVSSAHLRYKEVMGESISIPEGFYPGSYLKDLAKKLHNQYGAKFISLNEEAIYADFRKIVINGMLDLIKSDLAALKVQHDNFFFESSLHAGKASDLDLVAEAVNILKQQGLVYMGRLPAPKGEEDPNWVDRGEQLLFKATSFGDDQDRSVTKSDGSWTYLAGDMPYAKSKIDRKFDRNIIILGADHAGYVKRLQALYNAFSKGICTAEVLLSQMVNFIKDGEPVKMSKRAGNFTTVADVVREVGPDVLRFIMLTRKNDIVLDFDLDLVKTQSKENPVFYVQYACVRGTSVLENAKIQSSNAYDIFNAKKYDLSLLKAEPEINLIKLMSSWPKTLISSEINGEVHKIVYFLTELASEFHSFWNLGKEHVDYRFIIQEEVELTAARLALINSVVNIIKIGLNLVGVEPLQKM